MNVYVTRDSVCAGDDGDAPHAREVVLPEGMEVEGLIREVVRAAKLPGIHGGKATWALSSIEPLAVVAEEWGEARMVKMIPPRMGALDIREGVFRAHFSYFAQEDPGVVLRVLQRLRVRAE